MKQIMKQLRLVNLILPVVLILLLSGCGAVTSVPTTIPAATVAPITIAAATREGDHRGVASTPATQPVPPLYRDCVSGEIPQKLVFDDLHQSHPGQPDTPFVAAGHRLYVIGDIDGSFRPRSNPYERTEAEMACHPPAGDLGGVWAQPTKALDGYVYVLKVGDEVWPLLDATQFTQRLTGVQFTFQRDGLTAVRRDFVPDDVPALFTSLSVRNDGDASVPLQVALYSFFDLQDAKLSRVGSRHNKGEHVAYAGGHIVGRAFSTDNWAVILGGDHPPAHGNVITPAGGHPVGELAYETTLASGDEKSWSFLLVVDAKDGVNGALAAFDDLLPQKDDLFAAKEASYRAVVSGGLQFQSPDPSFDAAFRLAKADSLILTANTPALGRIMYAGLETFPYWFSDDLSYGVGGLTPAGFGTTVANHLRIAAQYAKKAAIRGRVPHQISVDGLVMSQGNVQETPQFVSAAWDYYRWTGDSAFLADIYPMAVSGLLNYNLGFADRDGDSYPEGPAMVERAGMGSEKLDSACYLWGALGDLAQMAKVQGDAATADRSQAAADALRSRFDADWWLPTKQVYAASLLKKNRPQYAGHWTVAVPLEVGLAPLEHGRTSLARIQSDYLNQWGLMHTRGQDDRVWTLPTGVLSRGAYRYGDPDLGFRLLTDIAATLDHGAIGCFHELIPDGISFLQSWSASMFLRGTVEDLMGLTPRADRHEVTIAPQLPSTWKFAELTGVPIGDHRLNVRAEHGRAAIRHLSGPAPLTVRYVIFGAGPLTATLAGKPLSVETREVAGRDAAIVEIMLSPGQKAFLNWGDGLLHCVIEP